MERPLTFQEEPGFQPLASLRLLVVVGLTGVGKTTFTRELGWPLLPNRRELVDRYILPRLGAEGRALDRGERFELTARWRRLHPGGLAEALAAAYARPEWPLVFDGLRGEAELAFARQNLPLAYFAVLEAPFRVRLERLLRRGDGFDRVRGRPAEPGALRSLAAGLLGEDELAELARTYPAGELAEKLGILAAEQRNYDPEGARRALKGCRRALFIASEQTEPAAAARRVQKWLEVKA
ncbi:hypothetical protein [Oceanithermus sp.]